MKSCKNLIYTHTWIFFHKTLFFLKETSPPPLWVKKISGEILQILGCPRKLGSKIGKWVKIYNANISHLPVRYNPFTNHLLNS